MKTQRTILAAIAAIIITTAAAFAAPSLAWDANAPTDQVTNYKVWEKTGTIYNLIATVPATQTTYSLASVPPGQHVYAVSAVNLSGESPKSNEAILPALPAPPANLRIIP